MAPSRGTSSYDVPMPDRVIVPDGVVAHRRALRLKGGGVAAALALGVAAAGGVLIWLPGRVTGVLGFVLLLVGLPTLPAMGVPATSDGGRIVAAVVTSAAAWWVVGFVAARLATREAVASWREWVREAWPIAAAVAAGAVLSLVGAALLIGVV
ncbi:MAG: hypothetical protein RL283_1345 [Actinomycetota bacterium]|jgi:hypothetical protein